jgi:hypothetical protein
MLLGAGISTGGDWHGDALGYSLVLLNNICTVFYFIAMKTLTNDVKLSEVQLLYYNSLLALPVLAVVCVWTGEWTLMWSSAIWTTGSFFRLSVFSGVIDSTYQYMII